MNFSSPLGVYVHIPYCRSICGYCDFVHDPCSGCIPHEFVDSLIHEIRITARGGQADTLFFGGGTPSLLSERDLHFILNALHDKYSFTDLEFTLEANPDDVTAEKIRIWKSCGVNRISLGVQSFSDRTLRYLGRRHDADSARKALGLVSDNFENWNLDLIYGAPRLCDWKDTLFRALSFKPPHIAAYALGLVAGTPLGDGDEKRYEDLTILRLYRRCEDVLRAYDHYEISNFAKAGKQSRHNLKYWRNEEHDAFGPGAYALREGSRLQNTPFTDSYIADPLHKMETQKLSVLQLKLETLIQHMRLREGISEAYFFQRFQEDISVLFGKVLQKLVEDRFIRYNDGVYYPTRKGFYLNDSLALALVLAIQNN
ncbi:MAG: radical SAM family heme chaperone HemW [Candidatus Hydrogenedens sp.]|jgi:oxygen-independent coproporphyrinogen-3 oxidase|nr:radical SAM family heme chaperone HemW [Candidatus Hydrogenedens sp.]